MIIKTTKFGEVEVNEELAFNFIEPILGYENLKKFVLIDHQEDSPFKWLQSLEDYDVAFPITIPSYFGIDYKYYIPEEEAKKLAATDSNNLLTINIVNIPSGNPQAATVNLAGPIVINLENKTAMQLVLINTNYSVKHKLFNNFEAPKQKEAEKVESKS